MRTWAGNHENPLLGLENCSLVNVLSYKGKSLKSCSGLLESSLQWEQITPENTMPRCFLKVVFKQHGGSLGEINAKSIQAHNLHLLPDSEQLPSITGNLWA